MPDDAHHQREQAEGTLGPHLEFVADASGVSLRGED
jgi:hypothetical protein